MCLLLFSLDWGLENDSACKQPLDSAAVPTCGTRGVMMWRDVTSDLFTVTVTSVARHTSRHVTCHASRVYTGPSTGRRLCLMPLLGPGAWRCRRLVKTPSLNLGRHMQGESVVIIQDPTVYSLVTVSQDQDTGNVALMVSPTCFIPT